MRKRDMERFRKVLLEMRARVGGDLGDLKEEARRETEQDAGDDDYADAGSDAFEREVSLNLLQHEQMELRDIDKALKRIEDGSYGSCAECQQAISLPRLKAKPFARLCIDCKRKEEAGGR